MDITILNEHYFEQVLSTVYLTENTGLLLMLTLNHLQFNSLTLPLSPPLNICENYNESVKQCR